MDLKNLKKDSWYWNKWVFSDYYRAHLDMTDALETGGLLQYVRSNSSDYCFYTITGGEYWLPPRCIISDIEPISSTTLKFFMLFTDAKEGKY